MVMFIVWVVCNVCGRVVGLSFFKQAVVRLMDMGGGGYYQASMLSNGAPLGQVCRIL